MEENKETNYTQDLEGNKEKEEVNPLNNVDGDVMFWRNYALKDSFGRRYLIEQKIFPNFQQILRLKIDKKTQEYFLVGLLKDYFDDLVMKIK